MAASGANVYLPLNFAQLVDLVKALPQKEKQQLINVLEQEIPDVIPEWQKKEVRKRINKYNKHSELLIDERTALKMINEF
ncbi:MAG TPA: hypothetical protein PKE30_10320 [Niabella sp.]|nr:hypothetical protein [Niabella sp.]